MNNAELNKILKAARLPERPEAFLREFPRRVTARLQWKPRASPDRQRIGIQRFAWALGVVTVCVLTGFFLGHWRGRADAMAENDLLQNEKIIKETLAMFPNRVRAIIQNEHGLNLVLSDEADVSLSTPIWVQVCDGKHCAAMVTFSGQDVRLGQQDISVLTDPSGKIILAGNDFLWSNGKTLLADGKLKIQAKALAPVVM